MFGTQRLGAKRVDKKAFAALLPIIVTNLVEAIIKAASLSEAEALERLYGSKLYAVLENEATKVWTFSTPTLLEIYLTEVQTGAPEFPNY